MNLKLKENYDTSLRKEKKPGSTKRHVEKKYPSKLSQCLYHTEQSDLQCLVAGETADTSEDLSWKFPMG